MQVEIQCCGASAQWLGQEHLQIELPAPVTVRELLNFLSEHSRELRSHLDSIAVAQGDQLLPSGYQLTEPCRVVLIPPVSGG